MKIQIKNLDKLRKSFASYPRLIDRELKETVTKSGLLVEAESKKSVTKSVYSTPVVGRYKRTGQLRASIRSKKYSKYGVRISPHTKYAYFVHEGKGSSKNYGRRPFMQEGLTNAFSHIQRLFAQVSKNIEKNL